MCGRCVWVGFMDNVCRTKSKAAYHSEVMFYSLHCHSEYMGNIIKFYGYIRIMWKIIKGKNEHKHSYLYTQAIWLLRHHHIGSLSNKQENISHILFFIWKFIINRFEWIKKTLNIGKLPCSSTRTYADREYRVESRLKWGYLGWKIPQAHFWNFKNFSDVFY